MIHLQRRPVALAAGAAILALTLGAGTAWGQSVTPGAAYTLASTKVMTAGVTDPRITSASFQMRLRAAIESGLTAKGYKKVGKAAQAQYVAAYTVGVEAKSQTKPSRLAPPPSSLSVAPLPTETMKTLHYELGKLEIQLIERKTGHIAWRGSSSKPVQGQGGTDLNIQTVVNDALKSLP
jgi:hypothetical protein